MKYSFYGCESLLSLPNLSKWNTSRVTNMSALFCDCKSLLSLPDISKWDISKVKNLSEMFKNCFSLSKIPNIGKWDISSVENIEHLYWGCRSLYKVPDISNLDTRSIYEVEGIFGECLSLSFLPGISKWGSIQYDEIYLNMINFVKKCENPIDILIKKSKLSKNEIQNIFNDLNVQFNLTAFLSVNNIIYHIVKYEGDRDKLLNYIENNL